MAAGSSTGYGPRTRVLFDGDERSKHIDIKYHFIKSEIEKGTVTLTYIPTEDNPADIFMKSTNKNTLQMSTKLIGQ